MGFILSQAGFGEVVNALLKNARIWAPVLKRGEGRFTDTDVVRYDFITDASEIEFRKRSDYAFKELLTPLSQTLFFFTEEEVKTADADERPVYVFLRSCDAHALRRLDMIYLENGSEKDWFYERIRSRIRLVLMGCAESCEDGFCVDMKSNRTPDGYAFSADVSDGKVYADVKDAGLEELFASFADERAEVEPRYVTENRVRVSVPESVPNSIYSSSMWNEYSSRCIGCGRCNFVCPTCTCYTMQDIYYTDNGKAGERRRVGSSCMVDGYTNVAGGGEYRKTKGERMRFKTLHKVWDFRRRFGVDMCVGCGRCDAVCPEYISFSACINKLDRAVKEDRANG